MEALSCIKTSKHCDNINNARNDISKPINILQKNKKDLDTMEQYSLDLNNFNPSKMSPPNYWKSRLESRLKYHYSSLQGELLTP